MFSRSSRRRRLMEQELLPHLDSLFRYALSVTRDRDQAEELTQETLARAVEHFEKYTPGTNARAWLFRILINLHINQRRARRPEAQLLEGTEPRWEPETQE
ncbi:MAG: RNA polymerase subunit sigma-24, partial [Deltaproteobacteria bacterium]|nr:RNA polymerase subunit sigma-24 [Deltaproteobacteria bacterium]